MNTTLPTYIGDCTWQMFGNERTKTPPFEMPTGVQTFMGRSDQTAAFRATYAVGSSYVGALGSGYILDNTPRPNDPVEGMDTIDLVIAYAPSFTAFLKKPKLGIITASASAIVNASNIVPGATSLSCTQRVSAYVWSAEYVYFTSSYPSGPRFTASGLPNPLIISTNMTATAQGGSGGTINYGNASAPAQIVAALQMPVIDQTTGFDPEPIVGTPWYRCVQTLSRTYYQAA